MVHYQLLHRHLTCHLTGTSLLSERGPISSAAVARFELTDHRRLHSSVQNRCRSVTWRPAEFSGRPSLKESLMCRVRASVSGDGEESPRGMTRKIFQKEDVRLPESHTVDATPPQSSHEGTGVEVEEEFMSRVEEGARVAGTLVKGKAAEVTDAVTSRAVVIQVSWQSKASEVQQNFREKAHDIQGKAVDAGSRVQERAAGLAEKIYDQQQVLEKVVQEKAIEVEKRLPVATQEAIRKSATKAQQYISTVGQVIDTLPMTRNQLSYLLAAAVIIIKMAYDWWHHSRLDARGSTGFDLPERVRAVPEPPPPPAPVALMFQQPDLRRKEPVEWLNMILLKVFRVYRKSLERWMVSSLQPSLDEMQKPDWVRRVRITQFFLGEEPPSLRTIERRTSRRSNDLQYHVGFRYTGGMRMTIEVPIMMGKRLPVTVPVGVRDIDIDAELWLKLKLIPAEPWVGTLTWAFVSMPKIKLTLAPFRILNLMAIPFLSQYLLKLFTVELPACFVRPNYKVVDLLKNRKPPAPVQPALYRDFSRSEVPVACRTFSGELSVTLIAAQYLPVFPYVVSDPYVVMELGQQVVRSKRNSETSIIGPRRAPIWNQDFQLLVVNQADQSLVIRVRDNLGPLTVTLGTGELSLRSLQDTIPVDQWVPLKAGLPPIYEIQQGEVKLRVTYKEFVDDEEEEIVDEPLIDTGASRSPSHVADVLQLQSFVDDISDMAFVAHLSGLFLDSKQQSVSAVSDIIKLGQDLTKLAQVLKEPSLGRLAEEHLQAPKVPSGIKEYFKDRRQLGIDRKTDRQTLEGLLPLSLTKEMSEFLNQLEARRKQDGFKIDLTNMEDAGFLAYMLELTRAVQRRESSEKRNDSDIQIVDLPPSEAQKAPTLQRFRKWASEHLSTLGKSMKQ